MRAVPVIVITRFGSSISHVAAPAGLWVGVERKKEKWLKKTGPAEKGLSVRLGRSAEQVEAVVVRLS